MRNTNLEIDGEMKDVLVFENMWGYIEHYGSDITNYQLVPHPFEGMKIVGSFKPVDDVFFSTHSSDMIEIDGKYFQHVNWGEDEYCLVPESDLEAEFWTIYEWNGTLQGYDRTGEIFQTEEEARASLEN